MDKRNKAIGTRSLPFELREINEEKRTVTLSFSSEEPYTRFGKAEILDHSDGAVDLTRLNEIGCVLFNHNRDIVLGKVLKAWIEDNRGVAEIRFDEDEKSNEIYEKVKNKTLRGTSVGYRIKSIENVAANSVSTDKRFAGPCYIARQWEPFEISIVSVPADPTVGVSRDFEVAFDAGFSKELAEAQIKINKNKCSL
nr:MAG TPA: major capsid protein [Caudovirales sp. ctMlE25]